MNPCIMSDMQVQLSKNFELCKLGMDYVRIFMPIIDTDPHL